MRYRKLGLLLGLALIAVVGVATASAKSTGPGVNEVKPVSGPEGAAVDRQVPGNQSSAHLPTTAAPRPAPLAIAASGAELGTHFAGLTFHNQRRDADGGNQLSLEPPDQGLCVGNNEVIEPINDLLTTYNATTGAQTGGFESLNQFFFHEHEIDRTNPAGVVFGTFISDPRCYYDSSTDRFFLTILAFGRDPVTGAFEAPGTFHIATSKTGTPTADPADWNFFSLDVTNDGRAGEQTHPHCPCFGDQPLLGIDANGVYISTNEYPIDPNVSGFNGAQIYAIQKSALVDGTTPNVQRFEGTQGPIPFADSGYGNGIHYSLQPALSPDGQFSSADNGTEYLLGALEFGKRPFQLDNRIAIWALTNTASLNTTPDIHVNDQIVRSEVYGFPPSIVQPNGPTPLTDSFKEHESLLDGGDDRMQAAIYANGHLWGAGDTIVKTPTRDVQVGTAYYMLTPSVDESGNVSGSIDKQGYLSVNGNSVTRPAIAVTSSGKVVIGVSLIGPDYFPSAAYTTFDDSPDSAPTTLHVAAQASVPADGFSGLHAEGADGVERWGDYAFAAADGNSVWVANEWIPGLVQGPDLANWGTYVSKVTP
jgi:hypothetical protein